MNTSAAGDPPSLTLKDCGEVVINSSIEVNSVPDSLKKSWVLIVPPNSATPMLVSPVLPPIPTSGSSRTPSLLRSEPVI